MKHLIWCATITCLALAAVAATCVPDGTSVTISATRPAADPGEAWTGATPEVREEDLVEATDDPMGDASIGAGGVTTGTVTNSGGDLFGITGGDQNGLGEGDCIEVKLCWKQTVHHPATSYTFLVTDNSEVGFHFETVYMAAYIGWKWRCSPAEDVCPCGSSDCPSGTAPC